MSAALLKNGPALSLDRFDLGDWPTPIERMAAGDRGHARLWCKREDRAGGLYGGNKVRKLEWLLPAARARGGLLSLGAIGSNYLLACALYGERHGVPVDGVVIPQPATPHVQENARLLASKARLWPARGELAVVGAALRAAWTVRRERGRWPLTVWAGGSDALGTVGWVAGGLEIGEQVAAGAMPAPDDLVCALGSGGMVAGLLVGLRWAGLRTRVHAIRVADRPFANRTVALWLGRRTAALLRRHGGDAPNPDPAQLVVHHEWFGPGYGHPNDAGQAAVACAKESLALHLDPTYTGKAFAGALALMERGVVGPDVLFINSLSSHRPQQAAPPLPPGLAALLL
ncbi:MAG: pyridoxal-phosphate dependent enzyme [Alphaproteobacteria bacterium]|nr:pyridoxal-phosphate dependent enzyme [Alphaproteobacteria bacterium]